MTSYLRTYHRQAAVFVIIFLVLTVAWCKNAEKAEYTIIKDDYGARIVIGVRSSIDEPTLRRVLERCASEHQDDAGRDYLTAAYLWVEAYLVSGARRSAVSAGSLRRYVPPRQGQGDEESDLEKTDQVTMNLVEARKSMDE
jgi:hypothetical protein